MKTAAIIAEYNPFHNGHLYQLNKVREITDADYVISVMSGNFMQRGIPALLDKYSRGLMAVSAGIDLALELPLPYALGSARDFAEGAVRLLNSLGVVDYLCFGAECDNLELLYKIAKIITTEPEKYKEVLRNGLKSGVSFPSARKAAIISCFYNTDACNLSPDCNNELFNRELEEILSAPNNILGIEYLSAIIKTNAQFKPVIIKRSASNYNDISISGNICSANAIRSCLENIMTDNSCPDFSFMKNVMPLTSYEIMYKACKEARIVFPEDIMNILRFCLTQDEYSEKICDMDMNLANKIRNTESRCSLEEYISKIKTKNYTYTRINRALLHFILNITDEDMISFKDNGWIFYSNILGFRKDSSTLIKELNKNSIIPLINKKSTWKRLHSEIADTILKKEIRATNIYNNIVYEKSGILLSGEFSTTTPFI